MTKSILSGIAKTIRSILLKKENKRTTYLEEGIPIVAGLLTGVLLYVSPAASRTFAEGVLTHPVVLDNVKQTCYMYTGETYLGTEEISSSLLSGTTDGDFTGLRLEVAAFLVALPGPGMLKFILERQEYSSGV